MDISIIIPTWNGIELLRRFLPSILEQAKSYQKSGNGETEVIVVDDASTDGTLDYLKSMPVVVVARAINGGFSSACNSGIQRVRWPFTILLNNDVEIAPGFFTSLLEPFADPAVFAVTARIFEPESGLLATAGKVGKFRKGFWSVYFNYDLVETRHAASVQDHWPLSAYAVGGFCAFRTEQARQWGGFDEMFSPFHWEDVDLSYRAWKRGWSVVYQPRALGWHRASSTIGRAFHEQDVEMIAVRNRLLFHWKNLHDPIMLWQHLGMVSLLLLSRWLAGDRAFYRAFWRALKKWPECRLSRLREKAAIQRPDPEIKKLLNQFARRQDIRVFESRRQVEQHHHERLSSSDHA
jgi:GT2 family glycosyltransferase